MNTATPNGFIERRDGDAVRQFTQRGYDWRDREATGQVVHDRSAKVITV
jgi:hypothetical protein